MWQYSNEITLITNGLTHKQAVRVLEAKVKAELIHPYVLCGYRDCVEGFYDKWYRYSTDHEQQYLWGAQAAINNGACIEHYIEVNRV